MKKLDNFLETAAYWKLFIVFEIICLILIKIPCQLVLPDVFNSYVINSCATLFSLFLMASIYFARAANSLHRACNEFEEKVHAATTKEELEALLKNDFSNLIKKAFTSHQRYRLKELYTIIKTKYQYI